LAPVGDISPDGQWLWDGQRWVSAVSPDGAWRWNGTAWVAIGTPGPALVASGRSLRGIPGFRTRVPWKMAVAAIGYLCIGGIALFTVFALIAAAAGGFNNNGSPGAEAAVTPSAPQVAASSPSPAPIQSSPTPNKSTVPSPKPSPRPKPSSVPKPPPVKSTCGAPSNPWGYNFCGGQYIYSPASAFCTYFHCIASFWTSTNGYVDQCVDGTYSHSGGRQGACSHHGGERRALYRP
jgi:hypothetical protein